MQNFVGPPHKQTWGGKQEWGEASSELHPKTPNFCFFARVRRHERRHGPKPAEVPEGELEGEHHTLTLNHHGRRQRRCGAGVRVWCSQRRPLPAARVAAARLSRS